MKQCPVCQARTFDDASVCFGCMFRFDGAGEGGDGGQQGSDARGKHASHVESSGMPSLAEGASEVPRGMQASQPNRAAQGWTVRLDSPSENSGPAQSMVAGEGAVSLGNEWVTQATFPLVISIYPGKEASADHEENAGGGSGGVLQVGGLRDDAAHTVGAGSLR